MVLPNQNPKFSSNENRKKERSTFLIPFSKSQKCLRMVNRILVTGGTGLLGSAINHVIATEAVGSRFGKTTSDEEWIYLNSKDGDLR